jgi:methionine aminopeptidase
LHWPDRRLTPDDVLFLDFGPVFDGWEADYARTNVLGDDPDKKRLVQDLKSAISAGKRFIVVG